jgi:hypothetical protein
MKNTSVSKENSAAAGGKNLFTQPLSKHNSARSGVKNARTPNKILRGEAADTAGK